MTAKNPADLAAQREAITHDMMSGAKVIYDEAARWVAEGHEPFELEITKPALFDPEPSWLFVDDEFAQRIVDRGLLPVARAVLRDRDRLAALDGKRHYVSTSTDCTVVSGVVSEALTIAHRGRSERLPNAPRPRPAAAAPRAAAAPEAALPVVNVTVNMPQPGPVQRDTTFVTDEGGRIVGKHETETAVSEPAPPAHPRRPRRPRGEAGQA